MSSIQTARGDLQNAAKSLDQTNPMNYPEGLGNVELARAELLLAKGQFQAAAEEAKRSAADFANAHLDEGSAKALVMESNALEMLGREPEALAISQEAQRRAARSPDPVANALAGLVFWRLSGKSDESVPADLHATVARLRSPELLLEQDFDRAMRAKRAGSPNASRMFHALANHAAEQGYISMSQRARALGL